ncbi:MAG: site-specific integrase, partial [Bacteroidota bacterium]
MSEHYQIPLQQFIDYLRFEKRYSAHTILAYQTDLEQFFAYLQSQYDGINILEINTPMIKSWLAEIKGDEISSRSIKRKISSLKSFFKFHLKLGHIKVSPVATIIAPKISKRLPSFVEERDMNTLLNTLDFEDSWEGKTERLVLLTFYHTGIRLSELINLPIQQIDFHYNQIKVLGKGNKERIIPITSELVQSLQEYM